MEPTRTTRQAGERTGGRRRKHIVNPAFQWKCTAMIVVGVFVVSSLITVAVFGIIYQLVRARTLDYPTATYADVVLTVVLCALGFAVAPAAAFGFWSVFFTHRICGPMKVMERYLTEIIHGRFPQRRALRKKDHFKHLHDVFWRAMDAMEAKRQADLTALTEVLNLAQSAVEVDDESSKRAIAAIAAQTESLCAETAASLKIPYCSGATISVSEREQPSESARNVCAEGPCGQQDGARQTVDND